MDLNIQQYLHLFRARLALIVSTLIVSVVIALTVTMIQPETFQASTTLNFELSASDPISARQSSVARGVGYVTTQIGIITSLNVAQRVVDSLSEGDKARLEQSFYMEHTLIDELLNWPISIMFDAMNWVQFVMEGEENAEDILPSESESESESEPGLALSELAEFSWLAKALRGRLEVEPVFATRIVTVTYKSTDPYVAALIANSVAEQYIETNIQMLVDPARRATKWLGQQIKKLKDTLDAKRLALIEFQQSKGIVASDEKLDLENSRLNQLSSQLVITQQEASVSKTEMEQMEAIIKKGRGLLSLEQFHSHPVIQSIQSDIRTLERQQTEMSGKFGANHPQFKRVVAEIANLKSKRTREINSIASGVRNAAKLSDGKLVALRTAVSKQKEMVLGLKNQHASIAILVSDVESAEDSYNRVLADFNDSSRNSLVDQTTANIVDAAAKPGGASGPNVLKNIVVGVTLGLTLALGLVLLAELVSRKIRSPEDIRELEIPLLGSLQNV